MKTHLLRPTKGFSRALSKSHSPETKTGAIQARHSHTFARFSTSTQLLDPLPQDLKADTAKARKVEREFLLTLLKNAPTKRDAKSYISQFELPEEKEDDATTGVGSAPLTQNEQTAARLGGPSADGVNLGNFYTAVHQSPVFSYSQKSQTQRPAIQKPNAIHVALVKLRLPHTLDDTILGGIGLTISQLVRLGLNIAVVVDYGKEPAQENGKHSRQWEHWIHEQTDRVVEVIADHNVAGAMKMSDALSETAIEQDSLEEPSLKGWVSVGNRNLLSPLLGTGMVLVVPPIAVNNVSSKVVHVDPDDVVLALTRDLSDKKARPANNAHAERLARSAPEKTTLDRIIVLDPLGGIPSASRPDKAHVFINIEEEYGCIKKELEYLDQQRLAKTVPHESAETEASILGSGNPLSTFVEREVVPLPGSQQQHASLEAQVEGPMEQHARNLDVVRAALRILPPSSSGLIITPAAAAISSHLEEVLPLQATGVRTRRLRNPLIHNLLTDKPMISSSLPHSRFPRPDSDDEPNQPTFLKRGIPVTILPDIYENPWQPPGSAGAIPLSLLDPRIDFDRLIHLIEDSFGRKLDVENYLKRVEGCIAGIIIAGNYEGGAICTWETPPNFPNSPPIPYLDKFAVLRSAQGTGGVADIVFRALLRTCFPNGCVWRSRSNNPVNKWYMERSTGSWKLPGGQWTMFWTQEGTHCMDRYNPEDHQTWRDWVDVCSGVVPTWLDNRPPD